MLCVTAAGHGDAGATRELIARTQPAAEINEARRQRGNEQELQLLMTCIVRRGCRFNLLGDRHQRRRRCCFGVSDGRRANGREAGKFLEC